MNKPYTVIGYEWQKEDTYGHNHSYAQEPLVYHIEAESVNHAGHVAEVRHREEFADGNVVCRNFTPTLVIEGHPPVHQRW